jgi:hypothetical protein
MDIMLLRGGYAVNDLAPPNPALQAPCAAARRNSVVHRQGRSYPFDRVDGSVEGNEGRSLAGIAG